MDEAKRTAFFTVHRNKGYSQVHILFPHQIHGCQESADKSSETKQKKQQNNTVGTNRAGYTEAQAILALQGRLDETRCYIHFVMHD